LRIDTATEESIQLFLLRFQHREAEFAVTPVSRAIADYSAIFGSLISDNEQPAIAADSFTLKSLLWSYIRSCHAVLLRDNSAQFTRASHFIGVEKQWILFQSFGDNTVPIIRISYTYTRQSGLFV
jgi:hypothetical protein